MQCYQMPLLNRFKATPKSTLSKAFTNVTSVKSVMTKAKGIIVLILMSVTLSVVKIMMTVWNYYVPIQKV